MWARTITLVRIRHVKKDNSCTCWVVPLGPYDKVSPSVLCSVTIKVAQHTWIVSQIKTEKFDNEK